MTVFEYKPKYFLKVLILLVFSLLPVLLSNNQLYKSVTYYFIFFCLQAVVHFYCLAKKLLITDSGIEQKIFWNLSFYKYNWTDMEEAYVIESDNQTPKSSLQSMMEPFAAIKWFAEKSVGNRVKIIIANGETPLFLNMKEIKNSLELYKLLNERIRFVKY